jgi:general stress protein 26
MSQGGHGGDRSFDHLVGPALVTAGLAMPRSFNGWYASQPSEITGSGGNMAQSITVARFRDVAGGLQKGQFAVGDRVKIKGLSDLDPIYKALLDRPITVTLGLIGPDGRIGLTPMWFDYEGDKVLVNTASHRAKCDWIRKNPKITILIVNPDNAYHWVQLKCTVEREEREWEPGGERVAKQLDKIWTKFTGNPPPYGLRDPAIDEKRVLFICNVDRIATFGKP